MYNPTRNAKITGIGFASKRQYASLQILRAVAAWMVVYNHYMYMFFNFQSETVFGYFFSPYGSFGVDIFFVLSGFVMYNSTRNTKITGRSFFAQRVFRIVPAYWLYTLLMVVFLKLLPTDFSYTSYNARSLLLSILFYPNHNPSGMGEFPLNTVGWTLNFEMIFYLFLAVSLFFQGAGQP